MNILVGASRSLATEAKTTATTAVTEARQMNSGYTATTKSIFEKKIYTIRGKAFRENWTNFPPTDRGCLNVYIYMGLDVLFTSKKFSVFGNLYYNISFNGIQSRIYAIR